MLLGGRGQVKDPKASEYSLPRWGAEDWELPLSKRKCLLMIDPGYKHEQPQFLPLDVCSLRLGTNSVTVQGCVVVAVHPRSQPTRHQLLCMRVISSALCCPQVAMEVTANCIVQCALHTPPPPYLPLL